MGLRLLRLRSWSPLRWVANRWKWLAIGLLAVYLLGPRIILEVSGPSDGCRPAQERNGATCQWSSRYVPPACRAGGHFPECRWVDTELVRYPAKQRFALYLSTIQVRLIDVDLASGRFEGFGIRHPAR